MPLRRSLLTVLCLAIFGTVPTVAQEKDPFAEWDRVHTPSSQKSRPADQKKKPAIAGVSSAVDKSAKDKPVVEQTAEKPSVTYFSASQVPIPTAESVQPATAAPIPLREKNRHDLRLSDFVLKLRQQRPQSQLSRVRQVLPPQLIYPKLMRAKSLQSRCSQKNRNSHNLAAFETLISRMMASQQPGRRFARLEAQTKRRKTQIRSKSF